MQPILSLTDPVQDLPALPAVVADINVQLASATTSAPQLAQSIMWDPALTSRLLRLVNSPFFGLKRAIGSPIEAIMLLGFQAVRDLALATTVLDLFPADACAAFDPRRLWEHAIATAVAASLLGRQAGCDPAEELFVAGLLHDLGKIVLYVHYRPTFFEVLASAECHDAPIWASEQRITGTTHAQLGAQLIRHWRFPGRLADAIAQHHARSPSKPAQIVQAADGLARALGIHCGMDDAVPVGHVWPSVLGDPAELDPLLDRCAEQYEAAAAVLLPRC